jgi:hypothetical protein
MPTDPYRCATCGQVFVVPSLARLCEAKHASADTS